MIHNFEEKNSITLHKVDKPGITCMDVHPEVDDFIVTGGNDGAVIFYNRSLDKVKFFKKQFVL